MKNVANSACNSKITQLLFLKIANKIQCAELPCVTPHFNMHNIKKTCTQELIFNQNE